MEQLQSWADKLNIPICKGAPGQDPASVCYDAHTQAIREGFQYLICDTAGRLHTRHNRMEELSKIRRTLAKQDASAPHSTLCLLYTSLVNWLFSATKKDTSRAKTNFLPGNAFKW